MIDLLFMDPIANVGTDTRWKMLGMAIVKQAILDWKESVLALSRPETASPEWLALKRDAEEFLNSSWCEFYSNLDGKTLLRKMKEGRI